MSNDWNHNGHIGFDSSNCNKSATVYIHKTGLTRVINFHNGFQNTRA